jgi:hypothetical protein
MARPSDIVRHGLNNYCPFCGSLAWSKPLVGSRVVMLSGYRCGDAAEIVEIEDDGDVLVCKFDTDPSDYLSRENRKHELILPESLFGVPDWAPPISVEDAGAIHQRMLEALFEAFENGDPVPQRRMLQALVASVWSRQLPLAASDIWPMMAAHGWADETQNLVSDRYSFGLGLLELTGGKKPIKRKRMSPFSSFRYTPKSRNR